MRNPNTSRPEAEKASASVARASKANRPDENKTKTKTEAKPKTKMKPETRARLSQRTAGTGRALPKLTKDRPTLCGANAMQSARGVALNTNEKRGTEARPHDAREAKARRKRRTRAKLKSTKATKLMT